MHFCGRPMVAHTEGFLNVPVGANCVRPFGCGATSYLCGRPMVAPTNNVPKNRDVILPSPAGEGGPQTLRLPWMRCRLRSNRVLNRCNTALARANAVRHYRRTSKHYRRGDLGTPKTRFAHFREPSPVFARNKNNASYSAQTKNPPRRIFYS